MNILSTTLNNSQGLEGYTDPLIFMIPLAIAFVVIVIVASASQIDSKQRKIRNEDRLLDTLERIRDDSSKDGENSDDAPPIQLQQGEKELRNIVEKTIRANGHSDDESPDDDVELEPTTSETDHFADAGADHVGPEDEDNLDEAQGDWGEEDDDFDAEEVIIKPDGVYCDPDGLCFKPLPGQSVEEARAAARAAMEAAEAAMTADAAQEDATSETESEPESAAAVSEESEHSETPEDAADSETAEKPEPDAQTEQSVSDTAEHTEPEVEEIEKPESKTSRMRRLKERLAGKRSLNLEVPEGSPTKTAGILMVGVNGGGKTTTVGKLARLLVADRKTVVLGAADTFRAAAGEQLQTWGDRVGVPVVRAEKDQADPASVAFDAAKTAREAGSDVVLIDTAGRLQNKVGLMDELGKIKRVAEKQVPITEVLLVIDATTGQNALSQAKIFTEAVGVTGIVLTKLDGSAKGGVIVPLQRELGIPVKLVGLGEGPDDLAPFVPGDFADALLDA